MISCACVLGGTWSDVCIERSRTAQAGRPFCFPHRTYSCLICCTCMPHMHVQNTSYGCLICTLHVTCASCTLHECRTCMYRNIKQVLHKPYMYAGHICTLRVTGALYIPYMLQLPYVPYMYAAHACTQYIIQIPYKPYMYAGHTNLTPMLSLAAFRVSGLGFRV